MKAAGQRAAKAQPSGARRTPQCDRPFRVPYVHLVAGLGLLSALGLMGMLPIETWIRLVVWLVIGLTIFFTYARAHTNRTFASPALEED